MHFRTQVGEDGLEDAPTTGCGLLPEYPHLWTWAPAKVTCRRAGCSLPAAEMLRAERLMILEALKSGRPLVFLDFDGVLNHRRFYQTRAPLPEGVKPSLGDRRSFDVACVARVNRLLDATGAVVVVSSSWRERSCVWRMQTLLDGYGFTGVVVGLTPELGAPRGREIRAFLEALPSAPSAFVVIDDEVGERGLWMAEVREHVVQTQSARGGLTDRKAEEARRLIEAQQREGRAR